MSLRFDLNDKVVYPSHGVAKITRIIEKSISGKITTLYELKFVSQDMTILVPTNNFHIIGVRALSSLEAINDIFDFLGSEWPKKHKQEMAAGNWKHRNKDYQTKLRKGSLKDIGEIYRDLKMIESHKELSFCEKNLLVKTEGLLAEEISLVKRIEEEKALETLRSFFGGSYMHLDKPQRFGEKIKQPVV
jgi:CarD family transcriptional regulator